MCAFALAFNLHNSKFHERRSGETEKKWVRISDKWFTFGERWTRNTCPLNRPIDSAALRWTSIGGDRILSLFASHSHTSPMWRSAAVSLPRRTSFVDSEKCRTTNTRPSARFLRHWARSEQWLPVETSPTNSTVKTSTRLRLAPTRPRRMGTACVSPFSVSVFDSTSFDVFYHFTRSRAFKQL